MTRPTHLSEKGARFIAQFEGFVPTWYKDPVGVATIGYGHTGPLPPGYTVPLSHAEGLRLLRHDAARFERCILDKVHPPFLLQTRFDAICSAVFNLGCGVLDPGHDLGRCLQGRLRKGAVAALLEYDHAGGHTLPGLTRRRRAEARLFRYGLY
jgi:lysozyme